jgi:hypothetical protein
MCVTLTHNAAHSLRDRYMSRDVDVFLQHMNHTYGVKVLMFAATPAAEENEITIVE